MLVQAPPFARAWHTELKIVQRSAEFDIFCSPVHAFLEMAVVIIVIGVVVIVGLFIVIFRCGKGNSSGQAFGGRCWDVVCQGSRLLECGFTLHQRLVHRCFDHKKHVCIKKMSLLMCAVL